MTLVCLPSDNVSVFLASDRRAEAVKRLNSDSSISPTGPLSTLSRISSSGRLLPSGTGAAERRDRGGALSRTANGTTEALEGRLKGKGDPEGRGVSGAVGEDGGVFGD